MGLDMTTLLDSYNLMLAGAILAVLGTIKRVAPKSTSSFWGQRLLPILPLVLGILGSLLGASNGQTTIDKVIIGILAGFAAANAFKVWKTTVRGKGIDVPQAVTEE
jgi:hypothetical protein